MAGELLTTRRILPMVNTDWGALDLCPLVLGLVVHPCTLCSSGPSLAETTLHGILKGGDFRGMQQAFVVDFRRWFFHYSECM